MVVGNAKALAIVWTLKPMDTFLMLFPQEAPTSLNGVLEKILVLIFSNDQESELIIPHYINIFARILFQNPQFFILFIQQKAQTLQKPDLCSSFLDVWLTVTNRDLWHYFINKDCRRTIWESK